MPLHRYWLLLAGHEELCGQAEVIALQTGTACPSLAVVLILISRSLSSQHASEGGGCLGVHSSNACVAVVYLASGTWFVDLPFPSGEFYSTTIWPLTLLIAS